MKIRPLGGTTLSCVISQKSADVNTRLPQFCGRPLKTAKYNAINTDSPSLTPRA